MRSRYSRRTRRYGRRSATRRARTVSRRVAIRRRRPRLSRRRIMNMTSVKKSDTMVPGTVNTTNGAIVGGNVTVNAGSGYTSFIFSPTARRLPSANAALNNIFNYYNSTANRTSSLCYAKGFSERIRFAYDNQTSWAWRRVVFSFHSNPQNGPAGAYARGSSFGTSSLAIATSRIVAAMSTVDQQTVADLLFKGTVGTDWNDVITAPLDRDRIRVHSDSTTALQSPSGTVNTRVFKRYYPINKYIAYADDENINAQDGTTYWAAERPGTLGDVYVVDFFLSASSTGGALTYGPECRYYWHER